MKLVMKKNHWVPMIREEWHLSLNMGQRREFLNYLHNAKDQSVDKAMKDPLESMRRMINACFCELSGSKTYNQYPDIQNSTKYPYDLIVDGYTIDVKTPAHKDKHWVAVAEKYKPKACDLYLFIWAEVPDPVFNGLMTYRGEEIPVADLNVVKTLNRYRDHKHSAWCLGWARGDVLFQESNRARKKGKKVGYFMRLEELKDTMEDCLD